MSGAKDDSFPNGFPPNPVQMYGPTFQGVFRGYRHFDYDHNFKACEVQMLGQARDPDLPNE